MKEKRVPGIFLCLLCLFVSSPVHFIYYNKLKKIPSCFHAVVHIMKDFREISAFLLLFLVYNETVLKTKKGRTNFLDKLMC